MNKYMTPTDKILAIMATATIVGTVVILVVEGKISFWKTCLMKAKNWEELAQGWEAQVDTTEISALADLFKDISTARASRDEALNQVPKVIRWLTKG